MKGKLYIIGIGPGSKDMMTLKAIRCIEQSDTVVGYRLYLDLIEDMLENKTVVSREMMQEIDRARESINLARNGHIVSLVSSGDPGIYGLAGLVMALDESEGVDIEVVPGVTALSSSAAVLGSPIMNDFVAISLSDMLSPWELIEKRIELSAQGDFVICVYNPKGSRFQENLKRFRDIVLRYRNGSTPIGIVKKAFRDGQQYVITDIDHLLDHNVDMVTTVIVGNSKTFVKNGKLVTPRGYERKYSINERTHINE